MVEPSVLLLTVRAGRFDGLIDMTIKKWLELARGKINALDAELILMSVLKDMLPEGVDRSYIFAHGEIGISQKSWEKLDEMLVRRATGEPLAYILGSKEFYGRDFEVDTEVLIPRPETESLVNLALEVIEGSERDFIKMASEAVEGSRADISEKAQLEGGFTGKALKTAPECSGWQILEIGTGSGCIAITLSLEMAEMGVSGAVTAVDVSETALSRAQKNATRLGATVRFLQSDLLSEVSQSAQLEDFDILVANLPYVNRGWEWLDCSELDFEPALALYAEENGLALYRRLLEELDGEVKWVILEADMCQHGELAELAKRRGYGVDRIEGYGVRLKRCEVG